MKAPAHSSGLHCQLYNTVSILRTLPSKVAGGSIDFGADPRKRSPDTPGYGAPSQLNGEVYNSAQAQRESMGGSVSTSGSEGHGAANGVWPSTASQDKSSTRVQKGSSLGSIGSQSLGESVSVGNEKAFLPIQTCTLSKLLLELLIYVGREWVYFDLITVLFRSLHEELV